MWTYSVYASLTARALRECAGTRIVSGDETNIEHTGGYRGRATPLGPGSYSVALHPSPSVMEQQLVLFAQKQQHVEVRDFSTSKMCTKNDFGEDSLVSFVPS